MLDKMKKIDQKITHARLRHNLNLVFIYIICLYIYITGMAEIEGAALQLAHLDFQTLHQPCKQHSTFLSLYNVKKTWTLTKH